MNRILIVRMSALGDIVHALPVLAALRAAHPSAEIDWLTDAAYSGILEHVEGISRRVVVRPGYLNAISVMRSRGYDVAFDLQGLIKSASAARLSGARRVIGFEKNGLREPVAAWFYTESAPVPEGAHVIQKNLSALTLVGVTSTAIAFPFRVPASRVAEEVAAAVQGRFALINPGAGWPNKRWSADRFGLLAKRIHDRFAMPAYVLWGRGEAALADSVVAASGGAATRSPETSLGDLLALCRRAALMVSGDTGPLHLAAAMGTPIVGLYGPTWSERNGPWNPADVAVSRASACVCHHKRQCRKDVMCLNDVTVDEVFAAVERRLARAV
jgi:lipopolysaccharide heptosyltransferase I